MDTELWQQIESVFHDALDQPESERAEFARRRCGTDQQLLSEVMSLLSSHSCGEQFLNVPGNSQPSAARHEDGTVIGPPSTDTPNQLDLLTFAGAHKLTPSGDHHHDDQQVQALLTAIGKHYWVKDVIGRGGMGTVFRGLDRKLNREVAIKAITYRKLDEHLYRRFLRESKSAAQVKSDHIVTIYASGEENGLPYLVMEFIDGPSLKQLIGKRKALPQELAIEVVRQASLGLAEAHEHGLIHRDIKPANILLENYDAHDLEDIRVKLIDFGLARSIKPEDRTQEGLMVGTPSYMSPEQLLNPDEVDQRTDIYGLGATLYEAITGEPPFRGAAHMIIRQIDQRDPTPPRQLDDRISRDLESVCMKALAKDAGHRYQTVREMNNDLQRLLDGQATVARPVSRSNRAWRWCRRNPRSSALMAFAALLLLTVVTSSLVFGLVVGAKNREILQRQRETIEATVNRIIDAQPDALMPAIDSLPSDDLLAVPLLQTLLASPSDDFRTFNAACALTRLGDSQIDVLLDTLERVSATPGRCRAMVAALKTFPDESRSEIQQRFQTTEDDPTRARLAILQLQLANASLAESMVRPAADPGPMTEFIHFLPIWHGDVRELAMAIETGSDELKYALVIGLGMVPFDTFESVEKETLLSVIPRTMKNSKSAGVHNACHWTLRQWKHLPAKPAIGIPSPNTSDNEVDALSRAWQHTADGVSLVRLHAGNFRMGKLDDQNGYEFRDAHDVTLTYDFWMSDREISIGLYRRFLEDPDWPVEKKPDNHASWQPDSRIATTDRHPVHQVSWVDAVLFCNWLSQRHGLTPCYRFEVPESDGHDAADTEGTWECDFSANGYRLPTEAEWEYACRCGTSTLYYFGNRQEYLSHYGVHSNNRIMASLPCGSLIPNRWGLFDMHGNVWEWTWDWMHAFGKDPEVDPRGPLLPPGEEAQRTFRGGGVVTYSGDPLSEARGSASEDARFFNLGFRVVRVDTGARSR